MAASVVSGCYERFILGHRCAEEAIVDGEASPSGGFSQTFAVKAHQGPVRCVAARGGLLASGGDDDCVRVYDVLHQKDLGTLVAHEGTITDLEIYKASTSDRPTHLFSAGSDGLVNVWRTKDFKLIGTLKGHKSAVTSIAVVSSSFSDRHIIGQGSCAIIACRAHPPTKPERRWARPSDSDRRRFRARVYSRWQHCSGKIGLTAGKEGALCMWNLAKGRVSYRTKLTSAYEELLFHAEGSTFVGRTGRAVVVSDAQALGEDCTFACESAPTRILSPDPRGVFSGHADGTVAMWDVRSKSAAWKFRAHGQRIKGLAAPADLAANGGGEAFQIVSACSGGTLRVWDVRRLLASTSDLKSQPAADEAALVSTETRVRITCLCARMPCEASATASAEAAGNGNGTGNGGKGEGEGLGSEKPKPHRKANKKKPSIISRPSKQAAPAVAEDGRGGGIEATAVEDARIVKRTKKSKTYSKKRLNKTLNSKLKHLKGSKPSPFD